MARKRGRILETRYFGLIIGLAAVVLFLGLDTVTLIPERLETKMLDVHFRFRNLVVRETVQEGVTVSHQNPNISPDILIVGIDFNSLSRFGRWPFPRYRHADLVNGFTRVGDPRRRERALFLDVFFIEPAEDAHNDALLVEAIQDNGRVVLETLLEVQAPPPQSEEELFQRHEVLFDRYGKIKNLSGNWGAMPAYFGLQPPLKPYARYSAAYGHANYVEDFDEVYRRQALIAKSSQLLEEIPLSELTPDTPVDHENYERLAWIDSLGNDYTIPYPLTTSVIARVRQDMEERAPLRAEDTDADGEPDEFYHVVRRYQDHFIPAVTLALALEYFNKQLDDIEVVLGSHILIPEPEYYDAVNEQWVPYQRWVRLPTFDADGGVQDPGRTRLVEEIRIPINERGEMLINFMGLPSSTDGHQTYPVRSYAGYAARIPAPDPDTWPPTRGVENRILMVGPFAKGIADDEKPTPYGLMYGVEIHANALNTIVMDNFIRHAPWWQNAAILFAFLMLTAFMTSRLSTIWSFVVGVLLVFGFFVATTVIFDTQAYILSFSQVGIGVFFTFLAVVIYRVMTEEKDKRRIRDMFGKYVSPKVVDQILENPPELGGLDKELTVLFSDIRGFTTLSESMTPQELVNHLNLYLTAMTDIILEYEGTLDKYVGDEIMCFWGAPLPQESHAELACKCALKQMEALRKLNESWPPERRFDIGIGVNSGIMTVGNMGSLGRMNYTLTGDGVNLGARLEGTNKQYLTNIIISEYTYGLVQDKFIVRELDNIRVKGKNRPVVIYELIDSVEGLEPGLGVAAAQPSGRRRGG